MISQIPPKQPKAPPQDVGWGLNERASDLVRDQIRRGGAEGIRTPDPLDAN